MDNDIRATMYTVSPDGTKTLIGEVTECYVQLCPTCDIGDTCEIRQEVYDDAERAALLPDDERE